MKVKVEFEVEIQDGIATEEEIEEWLRFELHDNGSMYGKNPLANKQIEPVRGTFYWS